MKNKKSEDDNAEGIYPDDIDDLVDKSPHLIEAEEGSCFLGYIAS